MILHQRTSWALISLVGILLPSTWLKKAIPLGLMRYCIHLVEIACCRDAYQMDLMLDLSEINAYHMTVCKKVEVIALY